MATDTALAAVRYCRDHGLLPECCPSAGSSPVPFPDRSPARTSQLTGLANMVGIPSAIVGGLLTQKTGVRKPFILASGLFTGVAAFGLFLTSNLTLLSISAVVFGIGLFLWVAPLTTLAMEIPGITPQKLAILNGVFFSVGYLLAFFAPLIAGALRDATGSFIPGFVIFSVFSFSLLFGGLMLKETAKETQRAQ